MHHESSNYAQRRCRGACDARERGAQAGSQSQRRARRGGRGEGRRDQASASPPG